MAKYDPSKIKAKVMVGIPSRNNSMWGSSALALAAMCTTTAIHAPDVQLVLNSAVGTALCMNRIKLCKDAVAAGCTHILFLDDDMVFPMHTLIHFLHHDLPIVAANCARKELPPRSTARDDAKNCIWTTKASTGLQEVNAVGTAVMLIKTDVLKALPQPWYAEIYNPLTETSTGEDVFFCELARRHGFKVFIDHDISKEVLHMGGFEYRHQLSDQWEAAA